MSFQATPADLITLGIGPGSDIPTFLTGGLGNATGAVIATGSALHYRTPGGPMDYATPGSKLDYRTPGGPMDYKGPRENVP